MPRSRFYKLPDERRSQILDVAAAEFGAHGYEAASMNRILERLELSKGAAYYYFDGKEDLFGAVLESAFERVTLSFGDASDLSLDGDFWEAVERIVARFTRELVADDVLVGLVRALSTAPHQSARISDLYEQLGDFIEPVLQVGRDRGAVRTDLDFELLLAVLLGALQGIDRWVVAHWNDVQQADLDQTVRLTLDLVRRVAEPRPPLEGESP